MSELKDQLSKIVERVNDLEKNPSELTKDGLLAELIGFYDAVKRTETKRAEKPAPKPAPLPVPPPKPTPEPTPVVEMEKVPESRPEPEAPAKKAVETPQKQTEEPVKEPMKRPVEMAKAEEAPKPKKEPLIGKEEPKTDAADKKILAGQFNKTPLADLRSGIPLNEKFGIIRNLFKGNASDFGDAVLKLNNAGTAKEMTHYLELLKQRFEWDERTEAYQNFVGYVERKMLSLEPSNANSDQ